MPRHIISLTGDCIWTPLRQQAQTGNKRFQMSAKQLTAALAVQQQKRLSHSVVHRLQRRRQEYQVPLARDELKSMGKILNKAFNAH